MGSPLNTFFFLSRNDFNGEITAYGAGNDDNLNTFKAGPGTVYIKEGGKKQYLTIRGDTDSSIQKQTKTYISGGDNEFAYDKLTLEGIYSKNPKKLGPSKKKGL